MYFVGNEHIPDGPWHPAYLARVRAYLAGAGGRTAEEVLAHFFGFEVPAAPFHLCGIDHVAVYLGDYLREESVDDWVAFLREQPGVRDVVHGPSYIAPRHHGTPGYWINCTVDGRPAEMFACKQAGPWRGLAHRQKVERMSHYALAVEAALHVAPLITYFAHYPGVRELAFVPGDELGHTYGHLARAPAGRVLELVHRAPQPGVRRE